MIYDCFDPKTGKYSYCLLIVCDVAEVGAGIIFHQTLTCWKSFVWAVNPFFSTQSIVHCMLCFHFSATKHWFSSYPRYWCLPTSYCVSATTWVGMICQSQAWNLAFEMSEIFKAKHFGSLSLTCLSWCWLCWSNPFEQYFKLAPIYIWFWNMVDYDEGAMIHWIFTHLKGESMLNPLMRQLWPKYHFMECLKTKMRGTFVQILWMKQEKMVPVNLKTWLTVFKSTFEDEEKSFWIFIFFYDFLSSCTGNQNIYRISWWVFACISYFISQIDISGHQRTR